MYRRNDLKGAILAWVEQLQKYVDLAAEGKYFEKIKSYKPKLVKVHIYFFFRAVSLFSERPSYLCQCGLSS